VVECVKEDDHSGAKVNVRAQGKQGGTYSALRWYWVRTGDEQRIKEGIMGAPLTIQRKKHQNSRLKETYVR